MRDLQSRKRDKFIDVTNKPICYLCGLLIEGKVSQDHIPPRQFFTKLFRKVRSPNLLTLPTHEECNKTYQSDEDYFYVSLAGLNEDAQIHDWLIDDVRNKIWRNEASGLRKTILSEFNTKVSDIYLPGNLVAKSFDKKRADRIVWKIMQGLFYYHFSKVLPYNSAHKINYYQVSDKPPKIYKDFLWQTQVIGKYPEVFVYRFARSNKKDSITSIWALIFWQSIIAIVGVASSQSQGKLKGED